MSFDIILVKKDKSKISKKALEMQLWKQHWISKLPEEGKYAFFQARSNSYIEILHQEQIFESGPFEENQKYDSLELSTWASNNEWTINYLIRISDVLSHNLNLVIYDPQQDMIITPKYYNMLEESYYNWLQDVESLKLKLRSENINAKIPTEKKEMKELISTTVFVGHSFSIEDDFVTEYIINWLKGKVDRVLTGRPVQIKSVSQKVKERIDIAELVISIFTRRGEKEDGTWYTSDWVKEEAVYALGKGKDIIIIKEEGVEIPGLFGDMEYIPLNRKRIRKTLNELEEILKNYK